jgi:hypothetical protein
MASKDSKKPKNSSGEISNKMRADQLKVLEIYFKAAKEDESMLKFLQIMQERINRFFEGPK